LSLLLGLVLAAAEADASSKLQLKADPPLERVRPNRDEAHLTLLLERKDRARKTVHWNLILDMPSPGRLFSTDFPWIEGKRLLEIDFFTLGEKVEWSTVFPIRGRYELTVRSEVEGENPVEGTFPVVIREDPARLLYLGLSLIGLFLLGSLIGWSTSGSRTLVILALFFLAGVSAEARLDIGPAKVGDLTRIDLILSDPGPARVNFSIVRMEDQKRLFRIEDVTVRDQAAWGYHFFDGSLHSVRATVSPSDATFPLVAEREVHVETLEPPRNVVFTTYPFFLFPLVLGWLTGRWMKRRSYG
jgi:hypothetical protein